MLPDALHISGSIRLPIAELEFRFARSSGPGGQHVNKTSTKVELYFNLLRSPSIPDADRSWLIGKLAARLDAEGCIRVVSQSERSQLANRIQAIRKLELLLQRALRRPKKRLPTRPTASSKEQRLQGKKVRSRKIRDRRWKEE